MTSLEAIKIVGDTLPEIKTFHNGRIMTINGEKMVRVTHMKGFSEKYSYGKIGDYVVFVGHTNVCVSNNLYEEFVKGFFLFEKDEHTEPLAEYYEIFSAEHKLKMTNKPAIEEIESFILKHLFLTVIIGIIMIVIFERIWLSIIH